jgi:hypothetical protein
VQEVRRIELIAERCEQVAVTSAKTEVMKVPTMMPDEADACVPDRGPGAVPQRVEEAADDEEHNEHRRSRQPEENPVA